MATRRQPLNLSGLLPGLFAATLLCAVALAAFLALWFSAPGAGWQTVFSDSYLWHVVRFSFWQASLSALLSVGPAVFLARALYRRRFPGRTLLLRLCAMTLILPVLVAVFGILSVYGRRAGWPRCFTLSAGSGISRLMACRASCWRTSFQYADGHPPAAAGAGEHSRRAAANRRPAWHARLCLLPPRRMAMDAPAHSRRRRADFMLCFASFATVLSLGGGPKATTIELAIYRALSFDYDPARAAMLALIQMLCCLGLVLLSQRLSKAVAIGVSHVRGWRDPDDRLHSRLSDGLLIGAALLLLLPPLLAVIVDGINRNMLDVLAQPALWQALTTSLRIAIAAGLLSVTLTMMLLWSSRELRARQRPLAGQAMELSGMLILAMPGIVLATGFFLLLNNSIGLPESADGIVIFTNALMAIPYALKVLENPMCDIAVRYSMLCQSLGIEGGAAAGHRTSRAPAPAGRR